MKQLCYLFFFKSTLKVTYKPYSRYEARVLFQNRIESIFKVEKELGFLYKYGLH